MKKSLILALLLVLVSFTGYTAELTADSPAVSAPTLMQEILTALLVAFVSFMGFLGSKVLPLLNAWLKLVMHFRGGSVVADSLTVALAELLESSTKVLSDGDLSDDDKDWLKVRAKEIAEGKLKNLSGFYKKDLIKWLDEVLEVELGKLLLRIFGSKSSASKTL